MKSLKSNLFDKLPKLVIEADVICIRCGLSG
jgi:hypothetical protein